MYKKAKIDGDVLIVSFGGGDFNGCLKVAKSLDGREYNVNTREWMAPNTIENRKKLADAGFSIDGAANFEPIPEKVNDADIGELPGLYQYQVDGVKFVERENGSALIGDDMGLGKTIQAIGVAMVHKEARPAIVICPSTIKIKWKIEIKKWLGEDAYVISGRKPSYLPKSDWYIINYDILASAVYKKIKNKDKTTKKIIGIEGWFRQILEVKPKMVVIDECQYISNEKIARTMAVAEIKKKCMPKIFIALSGTPMRDRPARFFTILNLLRPYMFPNRWRYLHRYCDPCYNGFGWTFDGATNTEELHNKLEHIMIRRMKSEVLKQLPPKQKIVIPLELDGPDAKLYRDADKDFIEWLKNTTESSVLEKEQQIEKLKQLAYMAKRNSVIDWIQDFIDTGNKLIVFAYHRKAINDIYTKFKDIAVKIDGSTSVEKRQEAVELFQHGDAKLFVGQIRAAGVGIDLTAADSVAFVEFDWTPDAHEQAEDRPNRIGQKSDSITAYYLIAHGTVEDDIMDLISYKYRNVNKVLNGYDGDDFFKNNILSGIINRYKGKSK